MSNPTNATVKNLLVAEINRKYGLTLSAQDVQFQNITMIDENVIDYSETQARNTRLQVTYGDMANGGITVNVSYNRLQLQKSFYPYSSTFQDQGEIDISEILPRIAERMNRTLDMSDFQNSTFVSTAEGRVAVMTAVEDSLIYFGSIAITLSPSSHVDYITTENDIPITTEDDIPFQVEVQ